MGGDNPRGRTAMTAQPVATPPDTSIAAGKGVTRSGAARIDAVDMLRGLVIVVMVLDHVRDFFHATAFTADPMALDSGNPALFLTRWVTHLCAPTFVFLAGLSVWLQKANGKAPGDLSRFLLTRGLWLIVLEFTLIGFGFNFGWWLFAQVIWAIGFGMIVLAALHRLPRLVVLAIGATIIAAHPALNLISPSMFGPLEPIWRMLALRGPMPTDAGLLLVAYPAIQWTGILLLGYGMAGFLIDSDGLRRGRVMWAAAGFLALFAVGRGFNLPGFDPFPWTAQDGPLWTAFSMVSVNKYPPSAAYVLLMIGLAFLILLAFDRLRGRLVKPLLTFGRTSLFTYLLHV
ncbi:MAG TPA: heparan-alpha-glucosaminide N-acetyltransferase domain-containing protein, partial [Brevundimonas sp.]|nr:heparan-alpha-glucosaminide N-acetyltransferase domain-containing protein [Brevundimonas sp.]